MTGPTHVLSGFAAVAILGRSTGMTPTAVELLVLVVGTLAPDIDGDGTITKPGRILRPFLGRGIGKLLDAVFGLFTGTVKACFGHRGFIHAPLIAVAFFALGAAFEHAWLSWFALGYVLHLLGDALTAEGIPFFSPFSTARTSLSPIRTGSKTEALIAFLLFCVAGVFGWQLLPEAVKATHLRLFEMGQATELDSIHLAQKSGESRSLLRLGEERGARYGKPSSRFGVIVARSRCNWTRHSRQNSVQSQ